MIGFRRLFLALFLLTSLIPVQAHAQQRSPLLSEIRVRGNQIIEETLIRFSCGLSIGQPIALPNDAARAIRNLYRLDYFSDIQLYVDLDPETHVAVVEIVVEENPKLGEVRFEGNRKIKSKKLKRELGLIRGQFLSPQEEKQGRAKLIDLYREDGYLLAEVSSSRGDPDSEGRVPLTFKVREGRKVNLKRISFEGNANVSDRKLRKQMEETKQDGWWFGGGKFSQEKYPEDRQKVLAYYHQNGYRDAEIVADSLYYDEEKKNLYIDIEVREGPVYTFGQVTWDGNERVSDEGILAHIVANEGDVYSSERVENSLEQIRTFYADIGYIGAVVTRRETPAEDHRIELHYSIEENKPWKVREITVSGNTKTKDRVIRRELWINPGDTFSRNLIERSVRNLQQLNFFNNVDVPIKPIEKHSEIDVTFKVEEKPTGTASIGMGYSGRDGLLGTIGLQVPNFLGNGQVLDFQAEVGPRRSILRAGFTEPWLLNTPTSLSGQLFRDTQRFYVDYDLRRMGGGVRVGRRLVWPDYSRVSVGYRIEKVDYVDISEDLDPAFLERLRGQVTSLVNFNYTRDSRDIPIFSTSGSVFSYTPSIAGGVLGGSADFHKHDLASSFYVPLFWKFAFSLKAQLGLLASLGAENVPFNELYRPGGIDLFDRTTLRGYDDQSVGPQESARSANQNLIAVGGRSQLIFNVEITVPLVENQLFGLAFADAGNAWRTLSEVSVFDLRRSVGFGLRIQTPLLGIMGFDFAWGLDRRQVDGRAPHLVTHFQFGPQFF